jgi:hypothetical protein
VVTLQIPKERLWLEAQGSWQLDTRTLSGKDDIQGTMQESSYQSFFWTHGL